MTPDLLHQLIEAHDPGALAALDEPGARGLDSRNRTAFDVALAVGNAGLIRALAARTDTHGLCATIDAERMRPVRQYLKSLGSKQSIAKLEQQLHTSFGEDLGLARTSLLQACRQGDMEAVAALLAAGAKPGGKDLLGLSEPELCLASGGPASLECFIGLARQHRRKVSLSEESLGQLLPVPDLMARVLAHASLSAGARRLLLCYHCARLDEPAVERLLATGLDLNKTLHKDAHALFEVSTSHLLWARELPGWLPLAWRFAVRNGPPGCSSISIDPDSPVSMARQMKQAQDTQARKRAELAAFTLSEDALAEQTARRIELVDRLLAAGLDLALARRKAPDFFVRDLLALESPELLEVLVDRGLDLRVEDHDLEWLSAPQQALLARLLARQGNASITVASSFLALREAEATWELPAETTVMAVTDPARPGVGERFIARVTVHNVYGPLPACRLFLKQADAPATAWQPMELKEELIESEQDGETRLRRPGEPGPTDEAPWSATYESGCMLDAGQRRLALRFESAVEGVNGVLDDSTLVEPGR